MPKSSRSSGGLAVGVLAALKGSGGVWFGWSGQTTDREPGDAKTTKVGNIELVTVDLNKQDFDGYYNGFSNNSLWPLLHFMLGYFSFDRAQYSAYCRVNEFFARQLIKVLQPDDVIWVHDYHFIPLGAELRRAGITRPIGFFLHVPFPNFDVLRVLPCYMHMLRALASYDIVGFQTRRDAQAFKEALSQPEVGGTILADGTVDVFGRHVKAKVFPISIDVDECQATAVANGDRPIVRRLARSLGSRKLVVGVDRLDYSKGLELRFRGFESLLENYPTTRGHVVFMQIAPPTRIGVRTYDDIREGLERAAGNINGRYAEMDWVPIRYINRAYNRELLMAILRLASVGLVTPIRDGMNLVAKEYVASQDPENPGIPVLSTLCGAAEELTEAILVNPFDQRGVAEGLQTAIEMPLEERIERHEAMYATLKRNDIYNWSRSFVESLIANRRHRD